MVVCLGLMCHLEISDFDVHLSMTKPLLEVLMAVVRAWVRGLSSEASFSFVFKLDISACNARVEASSLRPYMTLARPCFSIRHFFCYNCSLLFDACI